jgi:hypothetical protein
MNLRDINPQTFIPMGHNRKALLVERVGDSSLSNFLIIPEAAKAPSMTEGIEPPILSHGLSKKCRVLAKGPNVSDEVHVGSLVNVPGAGNCHPDMEDGTGDGSRLLIREGDIAFIYEA